MIEETLVTKEQIINGIKKEYTEKLLEISKATSMNLKLHSVEWTNEGILIKVNRWVEQDDSNGA